ncbi:hypothetical protein [Acidithiobacillus caldus]|uniref:hypothetical protein n=1 Tax=Acidithiobacillus caldus TaxID=33059 RepID=UPI001C06BB3F|nr:hypothetical protein [Acidithiobacillus caldus]MBU2770486.1 hypothetical protein [Acidithiobacillus caldus]
MNTGNWLPSDLSDEAATALCDLLQELAYLCDSRYRAQISRYRATQQPPCNPERPWEPPPPDR